MLTKVTKVTYLVSYLTCTKINKIHQKALQMYAIHFVNKKATCAVDAINKFQHVLSHLAQMFASN